MARTKKLSTVALSLAFLALAACADRSVGLEGDEDEATETGDPAPGEPLSACLDEDDCFVEWCVHPAGEAGFCTFACEGAQDCPAGTGGSATATCLLVAADEVCALDCAQGRSCPAGMRCEQIETDGQARDICF